MNITKHALERMKERGFSPEMAFRLIKGTVSVVSTRDNRFLITGMVDGNLWTLVMESDLYTLITVRRAHAIEEILWTSK